MTRVVAAAALTALTVTLLAIFAVVLYRVMTTPLLAPDTTSSPAHARTAPPAPHTAVQLTAIPYRLETQ